MTKPQKKIDKEKGYNVNYNYRQENKEIEILG
jgi:hypothetical protein